MITAAEVHRILSDCMWKDDELVAAALNDDGVPIDSVRAEGVVHTFAFEPTRLESHRAEVKALLDQLHTNFRINEGGGWSFINLPFDADMNQWGEQRDGEALMCLGAALGYVKIVPRELWPALPGGVPYLAVYDEPQAADA